VFLLIAGENGVLDVAMSLSNSSVTGNTATGEVSQCLVLADSYTKVLGSVYRCTKEGCGGKWMGKIDCLCVRAAGSACLASASI
jgi:hypothetical protein